MKNKLMIFAMVALASLFLCKTSYGDNWFVPRDFATIQEAIDSDDVLAGDCIIVAPGYHSGAIVDKPVEIKGEEGAVINTGPRPYEGAPEPVGSFESGFWFNPGCTSPSCDPDQYPGNGATISNLRFEEVEFPVMSRGANDITVTGCTFVNPIQAISNWHGDRWEVSHNTILDLRTYNGGGIGILVGCRFGGDNLDNIVSHNEISGTLHVDPADGGGYDGTGIVLFADFRYGFPGADEISFNRVVKNKVSLVSDTPTVVDVLAIEITEHGDTAAAWPPDPPIPPRITDNSIGFNDLRGTVQQIGLSPSGLADLNDISRNKGENCGHGMHPSAFGPGGN